MAGYVGNVPVPQSVREDQSFTATAGQTTFNTLGYTDGTRIKVTLNGVLLEGGGVDYTATNGSDIVLTSAAAADDILRFETFNEVQLVSSTSTTPTFKTSATLKNDTEEDTDGGRESTLIFSGEQSGGEISTLAEIEASHDGTADDEKGDLIFRTNDGNDGTSPTERLRINSAGDMLFSSDDPSLTIANTTHEDTDGGRESTIVFQGEQSGGEVSTLAQIEAAHDGTADDEKGELIFRTNDGNDGASPTEAMRITSDQQLGLGTATPLRSLHVSGAGDTGLMLQTTNAVDDKEIWEVQVAGNASNHADFIIRTRVNAGTGGSESIRLRQDGGLCFAGDSAEANALNDYEEGTWTPSVASGTATATNAWYIKIGKLVTVSCKLDTFSDRTGTGSVAIGGLPFTSKATGATAQGSIIASYLTDGDYSSYLSTNSTTIYFYTQSTTGFYAMMHNDLNASGSTIYLTMNYHSQ